VHFADLALPVVRATMQQVRYNFFGPTCAVYRMETYSALPVGWSPAPAGIWTDLWMWRKFLALPGVRCATWHVPTSLGFPASLRSELSPEERREEISRYAGLVQDAGFRTELWRSALVDLAAQVIGLRKEATFQARKCEAASAEAAQMAAALAEIVASVGDTEAQSRLAQAALQARKRSAGAG
jgi:hypothetical protein